MYFYCVHEKFYNVRARSFFAERILRNSESVLRFMQSSFVVDMHTAGYTPKF